MEVIRFMDWRLEACPVETRRAQAARESGSPESCGCLACRNFAAARRVAYPPEFRKLLAQLGIPENRESEAYHCGEIEPGLHSYGGWFHFIGRLVEGPESHGRGPSGGAFDLKDITEHLSVGFTRQIALVPHSFVADAVCQVEFSATVPWVLNEPWQDGTAGTNRR